MVFPQKELNSRWRKMISNEMLTVIIKRLRGERTQCRDGYQVGLGLFPTGRQQEQKWK